MTNANDKRWSFSTGERGRNRVRAFTHPATGKIFLEFTDNGRRTRVALGHADVEAAKVKAEELATALRRGVIPAGAAPTLGMLFDIYGREVTPQKSVSTQRFERRATRLFLTCFGSGQKAATLTRRDWDRFIRWRREHGPEGKLEDPDTATRDRTIQADLRFLHGVLNWAVRAGLLDRNPLQGCPWPRESSPRRPMMTEAEYQQLLAVARSIEPRFELALVLANETGHRISAIGHLRWSDIDLVQQTVLWRAQHDKIGFEHVTPLSPAAVAALERAQRRAMAVGEAWVFPAPGDPMKPCSVFLFQDWWNKAEAVAGLVHVRGRGWHSLRRKFATEMKDVPLKDLSYLGGWKDTQTVVRVYQRPDDATMAEAFKHRRKYGERPQRIDTATDTTVQTGEKHDARRAG